MENWLEKHRVQPVLDLLEKVGYQGLNFSDGCACGGFEVLGVCVEVGCGKGGEAGVWVHSHSCDFDGNDEALKPIGVEVARQIKEAYWRNLPVFTEDRRAA
jgi:hypothetical protein